MFGKIGRPPQDVWERRREIYCAVAPLLLEIGARKLTMRRAAEAAFMSVGGLYYYFPRKADLVLYSMNEEALRRYCLRFYEEQGELAKEDPRAYSEAFLDFAVETIEFVRPSILAALELGKDTFFDALLPSINMATKEFRDIKRSIVPAATDEELDLLEDSLRRFMIGACFDAEVAPAKIKRGMASIFLGYSNGHAPLGSLSPLSSRYGNGDVGPTASKTGWSADSASKSASGESGEASKYSSV